MGGVTMEQAQPIYESVCVKTELQITGWTTPQEAQEPETIAGNNIPLVIVPRFDRLAHLTPPGATLPPPYSEVAPDPGPPPVSTSVPAAGLLFCGVLGLLFAVRSARQIWRR